MDQLAGAEAAKTMVALRLRFLALCLPGDDHSTQFDTASRLFDSYMTTRLKLIGARMKYEVQHDFKDTLKRRQEHVQTDRDALERYLKQLIAPRPSLDAVVEDLIDLFEAAYIARHRGAR